jgi:GNAT superfamily N-acetyltransferase
MNSYSNGVDGDENAPPTTVRKATVQDIPEMCALLQELFSIEEGFNPDPRKQQRGLELLLAQTANSCAIVAECASSIIGMCTVQLVVSTAEGGLSGLLEDLVVARQYRGKGIGQQLLHAIEAWAWEHGASRIQLLADRNNQPAVKFYLRNAWQSTALVCLRRVPD